MNKFEDELTKFLLTLATGDEERAQAEEQDYKRDRSPRGKEFHESRRVGFRWRRELALVVAKAIELQDVPSGNGWFFRSVKKPAWKLIREQQED